MMLAHARSGSLIAALALVLTLAATGPASADTAVHRANVAEHYALKLLNCTRTGGWVTISGSCRGRGSGTYSAYRKPLRLHRRISNRVAWPWARTITRYGVCAHSLPAQPELASRMRRAGFRYRRYGENIGCGSGSVKAVVLASHRLMQAERRSGGGHWWNIKSAAYKSVGIGVAVRGRTVTVVFDFYGKRY